MVHQTRLMISFKNMTQMLYVLLVLNRNCVCIQALKLERKAVLGDYNF